MDHLKKKDVVEYSNMQFADTELTTPLSLVITFTDEDDAWTGKDKSIMQNAIHQAFVQITEKHTNGK